jgi:hydroxyacylglutathione hydrolase
LLKILPIPALQDNYIWLVIHPNNRQTIIIDPSEAAPVFDACQQYRLKPIAMLITHRHWDHTNGVKAIQQHADIPIYTPSPLNSLPVNIVSNHQTIHPFADIPIKVFALPGHTKEHVAYLIENHLFCGDILFPGACGKVEDGLYHEMFDTLLKVSKMPSDTYIYPAHEYTIDTLTFAEQIDPANTQIKKRLKEAVAKNRLQQPTLPVLLSDELQTNPFLRCHQPLIKQRVEALTSKSLQSDEAVFTALRQWKDTAK